MNRQASLGSFLKHATSVSLVCHKEGMEVVKMVT